jgi:hypothetical protein
MGRPPKDIDGEQVFRLARIGSTQQDIADYLGCARSVISERFRQEYELGRAASKRSIRLWQFKRAKAGSDTMLIHLGKVYLGQGDKSGPDDQLGDQVPRDDQGGVIEP